MSKTQQRISVALSIPEYRALRRIAEKLGVSIALVGRHAIAEFLVRHETSSGITLVPFEERRGELEERPSEQNTKEAGTGK